MGVCSWGGAGAGSARPRSRGPVACVVISSCRTCVEMAPKGWGPSASGVDSSGRLLAVLRKAAHYYTAVRAKCFNGNWKKLKILAGAPLLQCG